MYRSEHTGTLATATIQIFMSVTFQMTSSDRVPTAARDTYQKIIALALDASRPLGEQWLVTTHGFIDATVIEFDFARGTEAAHSLTFLPEDDDADHALLYRMVAKFLCTTWPGGIVPS